MTEIIVLVAGLISAVCAYRQAEIAIYDAKDEDIPYVVLFAMYGFI